MTLLEKTVLEMTLPSDFACTLHITVDPAATAPSLTVVPAASPTGTAPPGGPAAGWSPGVEKMLQRFEKNPKTKAWPHRDVATHLLEAGFVPDPPETGTRPYVRWSAHGTARPVTIYQEGSGLVVDSHPLLAFVLTLPGAVEPAGKHPKVKWRYAVSMDAALGAATALRTHADAN